MLAITGDGDGVSVTFAEFVRALGLLGIKISSARAAAEFELLTRCVRGRCVTSGLREYALYVEDMLYHSYVKTHSR